MRKITEQAVKAFYLNEKFSQGNTSVIDGAMYLHGNKIAVLDGKEGIKFSLCGWNTTTTRERLNGILYGHGKIYQKKGVLFYSATKGKGIKIDECETYNLDELYKQSTCNY